MKVESIENLLNNFYKDNRHQNNVNVKQCIEDLMDSFFKGGYSFYDNLYKRNNTIIYDKDNKYFYINNKKIENDFEVIEFIEGCLINSRFITKKWNMSLKIINESN